jgi:hypothetical protein
MAARALREKNVTPQGVENPEVFFQARSGSYLHDPSIEWSEAYRQQLGNAVRWRDTAKEPAE